MDYGIKCNISLLMQHCFTEAIVYCPQNLLWYEKSPYKQRKYSKSKLF